ncbi:6643_t:CDS:2 [Entrophospora sp. SA101]|nr:6643_t:CDS:2 [Entrophospora sp. SA101]CAJ0823015.1 13201_t:CDS:2 [Entrophospora sp. SA101]
MSPDFEEDQSDSDKTISSNNSENTDEISDDERLTEEILQQIEFLRDDFLRDVINHINDIGKGSNPYDAEKILDTVRRNNQIFNNFSEELLNIALGPSESDDDY